MGILLFPYPVKKSQKMLFNCLRVTLRGVQHPVIAENVASSSINPLLQFQCVRWRKRRWAPPNKSKEFYFREPTPIDPEEYEELKHRYNNYRTDIRAIRKFFKQEIYAKSSDAQSLSAIEEQEKDFKNLLLVNEEWNTTTGKLREARQLAEDTAEEESRLELLIKRQEKREIIKADAVKLVQQEMEKAMNTRINYNFAIDLSGNRFVEQPDGSVVQQETCDISQTHSTENLLKDENATENVLP